MILNLRGSGGAGKSFVGHTLAQHAIREIRLPVGHEFNTTKQSEPLIGYELPGDFVVLGPYTSPCGGAEGKHFRAGPLREMVRQVGRSYRHLFFEGMYATNSARPYMALAEELVAVGARALPFVVLALDTPLELCLRRLQERSGGKPQDEVAQAGLWKSLHQGAMPRLQTSPYLTAAWVDHRYPVEGVLEWFKRDGWSPPTTRENK